MKIGLIGDGAIGRYVRTHIKTPHVILRRSAPLVHRGGCPCVTAVQDLPDDTEIMVDCAGHAALIQHGAAILERGIKLVSLSLGALSDPALHDRLQAAAQKGKTRLYLASGAIGALDCLKAARIGGLDKVIYIGRKPPQGWKGSLAEDKIDLDKPIAATTHFDGTARTAARLYPKNANVAAAVALAGIGFDATQVRLIADPTVRENIHEVHASGAFGAFSFRVSGNALPDNPRSSALAAMSVIAILERQQALVVI